MNVLGLIPARGGSKGVPDKNVRLVAGRPLLAYTCDAALASKRLTRTVLSTDDPAIAEVGRHCGVEAPFLRPAALAEDETPMIGVVKHALTTLLENEGYRPEAIVLLQPTSPLRRAEHIDAAVYTLLETGADAVVSVIEVPHKFSPISLMRIEDGKLKPYTDTVPVYRRQDKPRLYARNGPAVLAMRRETVLEKNSLYGDDCRPLLMRPEESLDVDSLWDFELLESLLSRAGQARAQARR